MSGSKLEYRADDRSLLLPGYRRWLVDTILPLLPARLNPNTITHAGHALNLAAVTLSSGARFEAPWPGDLAMVSERLKLTQAPRARETTRMST